MIFLPGLGGDAAGAAAGAAGLAAAGAGAAAGSEEAAGAAAGSAAGAVAVDAAGSALACCGWFMRTRGERFAAAAPSISARLTCGGGHLFYK